MKLNNRGCAICGATWGDLWEEVEGQRMFFCCEVCAAEFKSLVSRIKETTGWGAIDFLDIKGDYRGRVCTATSGAESMRFYVRFGQDGNVGKFLALTGTAGKGAGPSLF